MNGRVRSLLKGTFMRRATLVPLLLLAWGSLGSGARAQAITVTVLDFEGRSSGTFDLPRLATVAQNPVGSFECDRTIRFRFTNVDVLRATLRFFEGAGCSDPTVRTSTTTISCRELPVPDVAIDGRAQRDVDIAASDLVPCDEGGSGVWTIWVLALNNPNDAVTGTGQQASFPLAYDFIPPSAPTDLTSAGGQSSASVEWTAAGEQVSEYQVFADPTGCTDGTVTSTLLDPSMPDESLIATSVTGTARSARVTFPDSVPIGGQMAVGVRGIDRAGNVGPLSAAVCVDRFNVASWWDAYCSSPEAAEVCEAGGGCRVGRGGSSSVAWLALLLGLGWVVRRSRR